MKIEVLYFNGCPTYETATKTLRAVLAEEGLESDTELVAVNTDEDARRLLFPAPERDRWGLGCRVYTTPEGLRGCPTADMLRQALTTQGGTDARSRL